MKYLCLVYSDEEKLHSLPESPKDDECMAYAEALAKSGHLLATEPLESVQTATTVRVRGGKLSVTGGPFAETKELIAGFWLWQCKSLGEAIEWVKRCPHPLEGDAEIEIRQVFEEEDFGAEFTPELREQERRVRAPVFRTLIHHL